ncbi:unnamed protein product [Linum trigynum]|uniref:Uncharacterized protein n=1 Tax=Linum trigynum TaxID=586398 RepID=A0AAV2CYY6_9ROSI
METIGGVFSSSSKPSTDKVAELKMQVVGLSSPLGRLEICWLSKNKSVKKKWWMAMKTKEEDDALLANPRVSPLTHSMQLLAALSGRAIWVAGFRQSTDVGH